MVVVLSFFLAWLNKISCHILTKFFRVIGSRRVFLSMSKDLGSRPVELTWLKVADINLQNGTIN
jgi:hypothetical protein